MAFPVLRAHSVLPSHATEVDRLIEACGDAVTRLAGDWRGLLTELADIGPVVAITRNPHAVLEQRGYYPVGPHPERSTELGLRLDLSRWHAGFANHLGPAPRVQFFDAFGTQVHAVALEPGGDVAAFHRLAERWAHDDQGRRQTFATRAPASHAPSHPIELLIGRLASSEHAVPVVGWSLGFVLEQAAAEALPVLIEVESPAATQSFRGRVAITRALGPWINVLDPRVALHVRRDRVADTWVVRRATWRGVEATLEVLEGQGTPVVRVGSAADPGSVHDRLWKRLLESLPVGRMNGPA
jgi:putative hemin transport protein